MLVKIPIHKPWKTKLVISSRIQFSRKISLYQIVIPHIHPQNFAERTIQTFKDYFIAGLWSTCPKQPAQEWDRLLPKVTMAPNLLHTYHTNPKYQSMLAPPGTKTIVHKNTYNRRSWPPHGMDGWNIVSPMEKYQFVKCYMSETSNFRIMETFNFFLPSPPSKKWRQKIT